VLFGAQVTEGFWDAFGMPPMLGRRFFPSTWWGLDLRCDPYGLWVTIRRRSSCPQSVDQSRRQPARS
jgi:hypothetical protein